MFHPNTHHTPEAHFPFFSRGAPDHRMAAAKCLVVLMVMLEGVMCTSEDQERIKMCGRDLIRLAVSSCGNSRLRRSLPDVEDSHCECDYGCIYNVFYCFIQ